MIICKVKKESCDRNLHPCTRYLELTVQEGWKYLSPNNCNVLSCAPQVQSFLWEIWIHESFDFWLKSSSKLNTRWKSSTKNIVPSHKTGQKKLESAIDSGKEKPLLIVPVICCLPTSDSRARLPHPSSGSIPLFLKYYSRHNLIFMSQFYSFSPRMWPMVIAKFRLTSAWF